MKPLVLEKLQTWQLRDNNVENPKGLAELINTLPDILPHLEEERRHGTFVRVASDARPAEVCIHIMQSKSMLSFVYLDQARIFQDYTFPASR